MSRNSSFAESLAELISEQVESVISDYDLSDKIQEELPDLENLVDKAVDNIDLDDKVNEAVSEAMDEYDFSDRVQKEVEAELNQNLHEYVENEFESFVKTNKFKELVLGEVQRALNSIAAEAAAEKERKEKEAYYKSWRYWIAAKWAAFGSWY